ncbi:glutathione synthase [Neoconidiobolus thromboides FSU 785]|nr:glutathione synthase [Neoconidiobolus thromboides FSU 785]
MLSQQQENQLIELNQLYCFSNGLTILPPYPLTENNQNNEDITNIVSNVVQKEIGLVSLSTPAPTTLYPTPFPKELFEHSIKIQTIFNEMVDKISLDQEFLLNTLEPLVEVDDFLKNLIFIYKELYNNQNINRRLGIHRSDYLLHYEDTLNKEINNTQDVIQFFKTEKDKFKLYQVELNTIASSFAALSSKTTKLHKFLSERTDNYFNLFPKEQGEIPDNSALTSIVDGLAKTHELYNNKDSVILFVVQPNERNIFDQRHIELELFEKYSIKVIRKTLSDVYKQAKINEADNNKLIIDGNEISVIYFRSGYSPNDYPSNNEWLARKLLESSYAYKCPNLAYQLVGSKKIQQVLADKDILKKFIKNENDFNNIQQCFTGLYPVDESSLNSIAKKVKNYVMKPSREGGGNNYYGEDILIQLNKLNEEEKKAYILMDKILPPKFHNNNLGLRFGIPALKGNFVSELGIYGIYLPSNDDQSLINKSGGHLLRTKLDSSNEGGVAVGHSVIDSPFLI